MLNRLPKSLDVDTHRIDTIRTLLDEDAYVVDIDNIAFKVIDIEIALFRAQNDSA